MISLSVTYNWKRSSLDLENAFVTAGLKEELYVKQLEGLVMKKLSYTTFEERITWLTASIQKTDH